MIISSKKANTSVERIVRFASKHRWAKYPGIAAVSVIYSADWVRAVTVQAARRVREAVTAPFRPLAGRAAAAVLAAAFVFMTVPMGVTAGAEETGWADLPAVGGVPEKASDGAKGMALPALAADIAVAAHDTESTGEGAESGEDTAADTEDVQTISGQEQFVTDSEPADGEDDAGGNGGTADKPRERVTRERTPRKRKWMARTPDEIAGRITMEVFSEDTSGYGITLNVDRLGRDITARFFGKEGMLQQVRDSFESYDIPTDNLYIFPVGVTIYGTDDRYILNLKEGEGYSADISLPIPYYMDGHTSDIKVVRLEEDNKMTVLDCEINEGEEGRSLTFNTDEFSVFAVVAYSNMPEKSENIGSGASVVAVGVSADAVLNTVLTPFDEDKRRFGGKKCGRKVYRIKRICKDYEKLL